MAGLKHIKFETAVGFAILVGAAIRFGYIAFYPTVAPLHVSGDGLGYHLQAIRLANGLGYTSWFGDVGAPTAHHPPGWVTLLGLVTLTGIDSVYAHQYVGAFIGLFIIFLIAQLTRRVFGTSAGVVAAGIAAIYPGFWVIEAQILSEPLGLALLGVSTFALYRLHETPNFQTAVQSGIALGGLLLVRSEQLAFLLICMPIILISASAVSLKRRVVLGAIIITCVSLLLTPWIVHNSNRFEEPVLISTNLGPTLLAGACDSTINGDLIGIYDTDCVLREGRKYSRKDRSVLNRLATKAAIDNLSANFDRLPAVVLLRYGRAFGVFRPEQTIELVSKWHGTEQWPVRIWVASFWLLGPIGLLGAYLAVREKRVLSPLIVPIAISFGVIAVFYGEPRYHTMADLSFVSFASYAVVKLFDRYSTVKKSK